MGVRADAAGLPGRRRLVAAGVGDGVDRSGVGDGDGGPESLTFDPGDPAGPGPVACGGDGPVAPYVAEVPGACSYTYVNASSTSPFDGYHFQTSMEIAWSISWTSSTGAGGALAPYTTSASALLAVAEVKGLVTCTGSRPEQGGC